MSAPSSPLRVMHLIGQLGRGGSERQLFLTLGHLDPSRVRSEVTVFNPSPHEVFDEPLRERGVVVHSMPAAIRSPLRRAIWLRSLVARRGAEIVHSWTVHDNPYAALCRRLGGAASVDWGSLRGSPDSETLRELPGMVRRLCLRANQRLVVNTPELARQLEARGHRPDRLTLLPNCVDTTTAAGPAPVDLPFPDQARLIGSIGNLRAVKNHRMFVEALSRLLPQRPDTFGVIVGQRLPGEPEVATLLQRRIDDAGLHDRIVLLGFRDDVGALLRRFDALCLTSRAEGTPNVLLEAMAAGCPVVATRVGGVPGLVDDGRTGLLVASDDAPGLAAALERLLGSPELTRSLADRARRAVVERHGCRAIAERLAALYEEDAGGGA